MSTLAPHYGLNPKSKGHEFHNRGFIAYYYRANSLTTSCPGVERIFEDCINVDGFGFISQAPGKQSLKYCTSIFIYTCVFFIKSSTYHNSSIFTHTKHNGDNTGKICDLNIKTNEICDLKINNQWNEFLKIKKKNYRVSGFIKFMLDLHLLFFARHKNTEIQSKTKWNTFTVIQKSKTYGCM